jgi:hypothetical protein
MVLAATLSSGCAGMAKERLGDIVMLILAAKAAGAGYNYQQALEENRLSMEIADLKRKNAELRSQPSYIQCRQTGSYISCYQY